LLLGPHWVHAQRVPWDPWHVWRTPGEDFLALTEELDKRTFLCGSRFTAMDFVFAGSVGWTWTFLESWVVSKAWSGRDQPTSGSTLWSVSPLSRVYSAAMPKVCAILLNSLLQVFDTSKLPFTVMTPLGPGILRCKVYIMGYCHEPCEHWSS
jgi:hypothetical protein